MKRILCIAALLLVLPATANAGRTATEEELRNSQESAVACKHLATKIIERLEAPRNFKSTVPSEAASWLSNIYSAMECSGNYLVDEYIKAKNLPLPPPIQ